MNDLVPGFDIAGEDETRTRRAMLHILEDLQRERNAIRQAHREWLNTVDAVRDPMMVHDAQCRVVRANRAYAERAAMPISAMLGRPYWECFPKRAGPLPGCGAAEIFTANDAAAAQGEREFTLDSGEIFVSRVFQVAKDDAGAPHALHLFEDVTEKRRAEQALRWSEQRLAGILNSQATFIARVDLQDRLTYVNDTLARAFGVKVGDVSWSTVHPDDTERANREFALVRQAPHRCTLEVRNRIRGEWRWVQWENSVIRDSSGAVTEIQGVGIDVTEHHRAEEALRASEERSRATFDQAAVGIMHVSLAGAFIDVNPALSSMLGYSKSELVGRRFLELSHPEDIQASAELKTRLLAADSPTSAVIDQRYVRKDASVLWATVAMALVRDAAGKPSYFITMVQDITQRKKAELAAGRSAEKLSALLRQTIETVARAVEKRDPYTAGHQRRVADLGVAIGQEMGLSGERLEGLRLGATIHDIGKIYVPAEILARPGKISAPEFEIIKSHSQIGYDIMKGVDFPWPVARMILQHHERLDGSGYPGGLKGDEIILEARILAVADVVEAMASHRPYRPGLGIEAALKEVADKRGRWFDPQAVDACLRLFREKGFKLDGA